jgi:hypothetical protein
VTESDSETPEALLRKLLGRHFYIDNQGGLSWGWREDVSLAEEDPALAAALLKYYERMDPFKKP